MRTVVQTYQGLAKDSDVQQLAIGHIYLFIAYLKASPNNAQFDGLTYLREPGESGDLLVFITRLEAFLSSSLLNDCIGPSNTLDYHQDPFRTNKARELIAFAGILSGLVRTRTGQSGLWEKLDPLLKDSVEESLHKLGFFPFTDATEEFMRFQYWRLGVRMGMRIAKDNLLSEQVNQNPDL